jgi:4,5-DOPA dioxygenase extradiol
MDGAEAMPVIFFGHGNPMNALTDNRYTRVWRRLGLALPKPKAILCISAHWYIDQPEVTAMEAPPTIHDFGGFPRELYNVEYPAAGEPQLAARVRQLLAPLDVQADFDRGLDHGAWSVLAHAFPKADVPVIQLSMDRRQAATYHYELGRRLAPLRGEGVLIIGSGNVVHNLRMIKWQDDVAPYNWAVRFNERVRQHLLRREHAPLIAYEQMGEDARLAIPTPEHYLPLLYTAALCEDNEPVSFAVDGIDLGSIGMLTVAFGLEFDGESQPIGD